MLIKWKLEVAGSQDIVRGMTELEDDLPDDQIEDKVCEEAMEYIQITWEKAEL